MSNPLHNAIKSIVDAGVRASRTAMMVEIVSYDHKAKTIDVKSIGQTNGESANGSNQSANIIRNISVANTRSIKDEALVPGDYAYIDFTDQTRARAIVLNIIKRQVYSDTDRTGAALLKPLSTQAPPIWLKGGE